MEHASAVQQQIMPCVNCRYLVSQDSVVPVKALTDTLSKHFPQFKFAQGKEAEVKKVIDNSKVLPLILIGLLATLAGMNGRACTAGPSALHRHNVCIMIACFKAEVHVSSLADHSLLLCNFHIKGFLSVIVLTRSSSYKSQSKQPHAAGAKGAGPPNTSMAREHH